MDARSLLIGFLAGAVFGAAALFVLLDRPAPPAPVAGNEVAAPSPASSPGGVAAAATPPSAPERPESARTARPPVSPPRPDRAAAPAPEPAAPAPSPRAPEASPARAAEAQPVRARPGVSPSPRAEEDDGLDAEPDDEGGHPGEDYVWSLDREGIRGAVRASSPAVRECYTAWLQANPTLGGKIVVHFSIEGGPDAEVGHVTDAKVLETSMDHPLMESCVLAVLSTLTFEAPEGDRLQVTYPFFLASSGDGPPPADPPPAE